MIYNKCIRFKFIVCGSLICFFISLLGCNKDAFEDDWEIFLGQWEWIESKGNCGTKYPNYCYSSPQSEGYTLSLEFIKKNKYRKYQDGSKIEGGRVKFNIHSDTQGLPNLWEFSFWFDDADEVAKFKGEDTLILGYYPFDYDGENIFVRK